MNSLKIKVKKLLAVFVVLLLVVITVVQTVSGVVVDYNDTGAVISTADEVGASVKVEKSGASNKLIHDYDNAFTASYSSKYNAYVTTQNYEYNGKKGTNSSYANIKLEKVTNKDTGDETFYVSGVTNPGRTILYIPDEVKVGNTYYRVVGVKSYALSKLTEVTSLKIGNNVVSFSTLHNLSRMTSLFTISVGAKNPYFYVINESILLTCKKDDVVRDGKSHKVISKVSVVGSAICGTQGDIVVNRIAIPESWGGYHYRNNSWCKDTDNPSMKYYYVDTIGEYAFLNCAFMETLALPSELKNIEYHVMTDTNTNTNIGNSFSGCKNLSSFSISNPTKNYTVNISNGNFSTSVVSDENKYFTVVDGVLYNKSKKTLIQYPAWHNRGKDAEKGSKPFTPDSNTEIIGHNAFANAECIELNLDNVKNTSGKYHASKIRYIGMCAFNNCSINTIYYTPNNYYKGTRFNQSSGIGCVSDFIAKGLYDNKVFKNALDNTGSKFSIGFSKELLIDSTSSNGIKTKAHYSDGSGTVSTGNAFKEGIQKWYKYDDTATGTKSLYTVISEKINEQIEEANSLKIKGSGVKEIIESNNTAFLDVNSISDLSKDEKGNYYQYKDGSKNNGGNSLLTKAGKWLDTDKTKAQVGINYTYGSITGTNFVFVIDTTASMVATGETGETTIDSNTYNPSSRLVAQYSFIYNMCEALLKKGSGNRVSIVAFGGKDWCKVLNTDGVIECKDSRFSSLVQEKISVGDRSKFFTNSFARVKSFLNNAACRLGTSNGDGGTNYTSGLQATNALFNSSEDSSNILERTSNVIFVSDGEPMGTNSDGIAESKKTRSYADVYTVIESVMDKTELDNCKKAMGMISGYANINTEDYKKYNKNGSDLNTLSLAFKDIIDNIFIRYNTVIADTLNTEDFNFDKTGTLRIYKHDSSVIDLAICLPTNFYHGNAGGKSPKLYCNGQLSLSYYTEKTLDGSYVCHYSIPIENPSNVGLVLYKYDDTTKELCRTYNWNGESYLDENLSVIDGTTNHYVIHDFNLGSTYFSGTSTSINSLKCSNCKSTFGTIFTDKGEGNVNQGNAYAYYGSSKIQIQQESEDGTISYSFKDGTKDVVALHLPVMGYLDVVELKLNLSLKKVTSEPKDVNNYPYGRFDTNNDKNSLNKDVTGCYVYKETDSEVSSKFTAKDLSSVSTLNDVNTPKLNRVDGRYINIQVKLKQEYFDYSTQKYYYKTTKPSFCSLITLINGVQQGGTSTGGPTRTGLNPKDSSGNIVKNYKVQLPNIPTRYDCDQTDKSGSTYYEIPLADVKAAMNSTDKTITVTFVERLKKRYLVIDKDAFDNNVEGYYFYLTTPELSESTVADYGTLSEVIGPTDSEHGETWYGTHPLNQTKLPIYDCDDTLVKYKIEELGLPKDLSDDEEIDNIYEMYYIPSQYKQNVEPVIVSGNDGAQTYFRPDLGMSYNFTTWVANFNNEAEMEFSTEITNINPYVYGYSEDDFSEFVMKDTPHGKYAYSNIESDEIKDLVPIKSTVDGKIGENERGSFDVTFTNGLSKCISAPCIITVDGLEIYNKVYSFGENESYTIRVLYDNNWDLSKKTVESKINWDYRNYETNPDDNIADADFTPIEVKNFIIKINKVEGNDCTGDVATGYDVLQKSKVTVSYSVTNGYNHHSYSNVPVTLTYGGNTIVNTTVNFTPGQTISKSITFTVDTPVTTKDVVGRINWANKASETNTSDNEDKTTITTYRLVGDIPIVKTSEDNVVEDVAFLVSGGGLSKIVTTDANGKATAKGMYVYNEDMTQLITYTIKELGFLKSGAVVGSQNVNDYVYPERYKPQATKTITINANSLVANNTSFYNELIKGTINVIKKNTKNETLSNVEFVLLDNNGSVVPLNVSADKHTASYNKNGSTNYTLVTDSNGKIKVDLLPIIVNGNYSVKEVKVPSGYNLLKNTVALEGLTYLSPEVTKVVYNSDKLNLTKTGNNDTPILNICSVLFGVLILAGSVAYVCRRKVKKANSK